MPVPSLNAEEALLYIRKVVDQMQRRLESHLEENAADFDRLRSAVLKERHLQNKRYFAADLAKRIGYSQSTVRALWKERHLNFRQDRMPGGKLGPKYSMEIDIFRWEQLAHQSFH